MGKGLRKEDNRGMSLVEIIIVIALISVIAAVSGYGLSLISSKPVEECTKKVEMILNRNRTNSMGKADAWVEFYTNAEGLLMYQEHLKSKKEGEEQVSDPLVIGAKDVAMKITYSGSSTSTTVILDDTHHGPYKVAFARDSGAVKKIDEAGNKCVQIVVYKGSNTKTIKLEQLTGKVTIE